MNQYPFNASSPRVAKARFVAKLAGPMLRLLGFACGLLALFGIILTVLGRHQGLSILGVGVIILTFLLWVQWDLRNVSAASVGKSTQLDALLPPALLSKYKPSLSVPDLWKLVESSDEGTFIMVRFGLDAGLFGAALGQMTHDQIWVEAQTVCTALGLGILTEGSILSAMIRLSPGAQSLITQDKLTIADIDEGVHWVARLTHYIKIKRPIYGGLARDWASGYTPTLSRFGENLSRYIEFAGKHFQTQERTSQLDGLVTGLNSASGSVVLVGEPGIGKTALLLGLADRLLQGAESGGLKHYQIYSLSASTILTGTSGPGDLERVVTNLFDEAVHAANIVIALDEAQLFFGEGPGAVNLSQILLPVLQSRRLKMAIALTPGDWQKLRATNPSMASLLTPLVLVEPDQAGVMRILADRSLLLEHGQYVATYESLLESYRLSGRYLQDEAYPGKALKVLEAAMNHPQGVFITEKSVQEAIESQFGVKVQQASTTETDVLLHLEDKIHERMINQTRAVSVVANALRRARAGVANPRRPIGSFLFLGPTGVGKTELAKSIAALYFGDESTVIRLDMSEYQQVADVNRILESAATNPEALLAKVRQAPFSVVLFDEIEKAHANVLNLFLQLLDEGNLTDTGGKATSFKDAIIIATSNAGADEIRNRIDAGQELESFEEEFTGNLISNGAFKPELLNRFDEIVLFRPLNQSELGQVVHLMVAEVNKTLANQKITVALTDDAADELVKVGYDPRLGARPMRRMVQRRVEDRVAQMILAGEAKPGDNLTLDSAHLAVPSGPAKPALDAKTPAQSPDTIEKPKTDAGKLQITSTPSRVKAANGRPAHNFYATRPASKVKLAACTIPVPPHFRHNGNPKQGRILYDGYKWPRSQRFSRNVVSLDSKSNLSFAYRSTRPARDLGDHH